MDSLLDVSTKHTDVRRFYRVTRRLRLGLRRLQLSSPAWPALPQIIVNTFWEAKSSLLLPLLLLQS